MYLEGRIGFALGYNSRGEMDKRAEVMGTI
jgi:hypothetical protein